MLLFVFLSKPLILIPFNSIFLLLKLCHHHHHHHHISFCKYKYMHFFLNNYFGKARYLEEKWNIMNFLCQIWSKQQVKVCCCISTVLCTVLNHSEELLKSSVYFSYSSPVYPMFDFKHWINFNLYDINGPGLTLDLQYPSKLGVCIV